jgi:hypothetical protein
VRDGLACGAIAVSAFVLCSPDSDSLAASASADSGDQASGRAHHVTRERTRASIHQDQNGWTSRVLRMRRTRVVAKGKWTYADSVSKPVFIVRTNYDFWYELAKEDGERDAGEVPNLNREGHAYYVSFRATQAGRRFWPDSGAHHSVGEAKATAEVKVPSSISWS